MEKYLEFIQNIISRMANNSFLIKGWSVTLVAALFALAAKETNEAYIMLAFFPAILFAVLDSYYLYQENLFCDLYEEVRLQKSQSYSMSTDKYKKDWKGIKGAKSWWDSFWSRTILIFHGAILGAIGLVAWLDVIK